MGEDKMKKDAWSIYREYNTADKPGEAQFLMAEEALRISEKANKRMNE